MDIQKSLNRRAKAANRMASSSQFALSVVMLIGISAYCFYASSMEAQRTQSIVWMLLGIGFIVSGLLAVGINIMAANLQSLVDEVEAQQEKEAAKGESQVS